MNNRSLINCDGQRTNAAHLFRERNKMKCEHNKIRQICIQCKVLGLGGVNICEHLKQRSQCRECWKLGIGGCAFCTHGNRKATCLICLDGVGICEHKKPRYACKICKGSSYCIHVKQFATCSFCKPKSTYRKYVKNAKRRALDFQLTFKEYQTLISQACRYCGRTPEQANGMGIDRLDNNKGYFFENCVPCCGIDNWAKKGQSEQEYLEQCRRVVSHYV